MVTVVTVDQTKLTAQMTELLATARATGCCLDLEMRPHGWATVAMRTRTKRSAICYPSKTGNNGDLNVTLADLAKQVANMTADPTKGVYDPAEIAQLICETIAQSGSWIEFSADFRGGKDKFFRVMLVSPNNSRGTGRSNLLSEAIFIAKSELHKAMLTKN